MSALLYLAGLAVYSYWQGTERVKEEIVYFIAFGLAPVVAFAILLFLWNSIMSPSRLEKALLKDLDTLEGEKKSLEGRLAELTTKRLEITGIDEYTEAKPNAVQWLRVKVKNPTGLPIRDCYGRLVRRRLVRSSPITVNGKLTQLEVSPEVGSLSLEHQELPPEGHRFPWAPTQLPEIITTIPGYGGQEFLYVVAKTKNIGHFGFPTDMGIKYHNWSLGDFELELEIGSESETFRPTNVRVIFRATGGDLELLSWSMIN